MLKLTQDKLFFHMKQHQNLVEAWVEMSFEFSYINDLSGFIFIHCWKETLITG